MNVMSKCILELLTDNKIEFDASRMSNIERRIATNQVDQCCVRELKLVCLKVLD